MRRGLLRFGIPSASGSAFGKTPEWGGSRQMFFRGGNAW